MCVHFDMTYGDDGRPQERSLEARMWSILRHHSAEELDKILEEGANPNALSLDDGQETPLYRAFHRSQKHVEVLLKHKADPNLVARDNKSNLLLFRIIGHSSFSLYLNLLADAGADINVQRESDGYTPIMEALSRGYARNAQEFLERYDNVDLSLTTTSGETLQNIAERKGGIARDVYKYALEHQVDKIVITDEIGLQIMQHVYDFDKKERFSMLYNDRSLQQVVIMQVTPFSILDKVHLRHVFNEHVKRGGTTKPDDIGLTGELPKGKTSTIQRHHKKDMGA